MSVDLKWHDAREQKLRSCQGFSINGGVVQPSAPAIFISAPTYASGIIRVRLSALLE
jgi:hypothetical protein